MSDNIGNAITCIPESKRCSEPSDARTGLLPGAFSPLSVTALRCCTARGGRGVEWRGRDDDARWRDGGANVGGADGPIQ
jgi:hypothetical protein